MTDAELGAALRRAGLTPRMLAAAWGTSIIAQLPRVLRATADAPPPLPGPSTASTAALRLLVAGQVVARADAERGLGPALAALAARGVVELDADRVTAPRAIAPVGPSLVCIDRPAWPDDSSYHLIGCLPPVRAARWLDVGTGCGFAPLARPDRGAAIVAADLDPSAIACARLGLALSGVRHVELIEADLTAGTGDGFDLVSFNLPIPAEAGLTDRDEDSRFHHSPRGAAVLARFVAEVRARLSADATVVLHAWLGPEHARIVDDLPGEVTVVRYSPDTTAPFGIVRWRPGAPAARHRYRRAPSPEAPHLIWDDLEAAATGAPAA